MKVWTNTLFTGRWPIPTSAVVVADTPERAAELLNIELVNLGLKGDAKVEDMTRVKTTTEEVIILSDGEY